MGIKTSYENLSEAINQIQIFFDKLLKKENTLEEFIEIFSESLDELIIKISKEEKIKYIGGKFYLEILNEQDTQKILVKYDFYFKDKNGNWVHKTNKKIVDKDFLNKEAFEELKKESKFYEIDPPEIGSGK